jgi:hypothetical protein
MPRGWKHGLTSPLFAAILPWIDPLPPQRFPGPDDLNALTTPAVTSGGGARLRFVPAAQHAGHYEVGVFETGAVPTRPDNWHDLFNALVWLAFPKTKAAINRRHREEILARCGEKTRGTARDVLTLFDEGGIIVASADAGLSALLRESRWKALFWEGRDAVRRSMRFHVFGHALYEKALEPYKGVTAKALIIEAAPPLLAAPLGQQIAALDARAAEHFSAAGALASTRSLPPLPVLGVPGWEPANESADYYDDASQFRPARAAVE